MFPWDLGSPRSQPSLLLAWSQKHLCTIPKSRHTAVPEQGLARAVGMAALLQELLRGSERTGSHQGNDSPSPVWAGQQHCLGQAAYTLCPLWAAPGRPPGPRSQILSSCPVPLVLLLWFILSPSSKRCQLLSRKGAHPSGKGRARQSIPRLRRQGHAAARLQSLQLCVIPACLKG